MESCSLPRKRTTDFQFVTALVSLPRRGLACSSDFFWLLCQQRFRMTRITSHTQKTQAEACVPRRCCGVKNQRSCVCPPSSSLVCEDLLRVANCVCDHSGGLRALCGGRWAAAAGTACTALAPVESRCRVSIHTGARAIAVVAALSRTQFCMRPMLPAEKSSFGEGLAVTRFKANGRPTH